VYENIRKCKKEKCSDMKDMKMVEVTIGRVGFRFVLFFFYFYICILLFNKI
jgi:hypothetical protein